MSNGYLVAAEADIPAAREIAEGFGLDVIGASSLGDQQATVAALTNAANVGLILSTTATRDAPFVSLLHQLAERLGSAQLIVVTPEARGAFGFLPQTWATMAFDEARSRSNELLRRRQAEAGPGEDSERAQPLPPTQQQEEQPQHQSDETLDDGLLGGAPDAGANETPREESFSGETEATPPTPAPPAQVLPPEAPPEPPASVTAPAPLPEPPPSAREPEAPPQPAPAPVPAGPPPIRERLGDSVDMQSSTRSKMGHEPLGETAPADATAFAPNKLRRGTPELVRVVIHQPKDLNDVIKAAKKIDPRTDAAPQAMGIGQVAIGASIGVSLDVRGGSCDGTLQRRVWTGDAADFNFSVEADEDVKQAVFLARVFIDDAQIGTLAFTRKVSGPAKKPHSQGDRVRLKRHKRVFLSYSSKDREVVSAIATAYERAGVEHFWDRASLKSGEEWHPRLRREIDRADLFHLCWSKAAAESEWVQKEAEHALTRRKKNSGKPEITVQMLDGPPWAPHPAELDTINFDDFVRAAIVGYARGDGT
jgi:hypothetical protein